MSRYLCDADTGASLIELLEGLIARYGDKSLPLSYYSKVRLMSWEAGVRWVEPDVCPLD